MRKELYGHAKIVNNGRYAAMVDSLAIDVTIADQERRAFTLNPLDVLCFPNG
jgi:hypothetical protein